MRDFKFGLQNWNNIAGNIIKAKQGSRQLDIAQQAEDRLGKQQRIDKKQFETTEARLSKQHRETHKLNQKKEFNRMVEAIGDFEFKAAEFEHEKRKDKRDYKQSQEVHEFDQKKKKFELKQAKQAVKGKTEAEAGLVELDEQVADLARRVPGSSPEELKKIAIEALQLEQKTMRLQGKLARFGSPSSSRSGSAKSPSSLLRDLIKEESNTLEHQEQAKARIEKFLRESRLKAHWEGRPQDKQKYDALGAKVSSLRTQLAQPGVENRQQLVNEGETAEADMEEMEVEGEITQMYKDAGFDMRYAMGNKNIWIPKKGHPMMNGDGSILVDPKDRSVIRHTGLHANATIAAAKSYLKELEIAREGDTRETTIPLGPDREKTSTKGLVTPTGVEGQGDQLFPTAGGEKATESETIRQSQRGPYERLTSKGIHPDITDSIVDVDVDKFFDALDAQGRAGGVTEEVFEQVREAQEKAAQEDSSETKEEWEKKDEEYNKELGMGSKEKPVEQKQEPTSRYETRQESSSKAAGIDETSMGHMRRYIGGSKRELDRMTPLQITKKYRGKQQNALEKSADKVDNIVDDLVSVTSVKEGEDIPTLNVSRIRDEGLGGGLDTMRLVDSVADAIRKFDKFENILPHQLGTITIHSKDGRHKEIIDVNWPKDEKTIDQLRPLLKDIGKIKNNIKWADGILRGNKGVLRKGKPSDEALDKYREAMRKQLQKSANERNLEREGEELKRKWLKRPDDPQMEGQAP